MEEIARGGGCRPKEGARAWGLVRDSRRRKSAQTSPCGPAESARALVFTLLDALCVFAGYGLAEVAYFRDKAPGHYWQHFAAFLGRGPGRHPGGQPRLRPLRPHVAPCRRRGGPPAGALGRHRGRLRPRGHLPARAAWPRSSWCRSTVIVVGCMFATVGMGVLRFHSRLFAWQRGSRRVGLRVAVVGSRDAGAAAIREMLRSPGAGLVPVAVFDDDARAHGLSMLGRARGRLDRRHPRRRPAATPSSRCCWPSPIPRRSWSSGSCRPARRPG